MGDTNTYQSQANELSQQLWGIANELRGNMDASEFKNYILGVIFQCKKVFIFKIRIGSYTPMKLSALKYPVIVSIMCAAWHFNRCCKFVVHLAPPR